MSIYHWKLGDIALAKVCQKVYAKVQVVKNEDGLFYDEKAVLGISSNEDGSINVTHQLCYHVETIRTNQRLWLPYTSLHLAERSRPFYGTDKAAPATKIKSPKTAPDSPDWDPSEKDVDDDLDTRSDSSSEVDEPKGFVQLGKDIFFDDLYSLLEREAEQRTERDDNVERDSKENTEINPKVSTEKDVEKNMEFHSEEYDGENEDNNKEICREESSLKGVEDHKDSYSENNDARNEERNAEDRDSEENERYSVENKEKVYYYYGGVRRAWYDEEKDAKEINERNREKTEEGQIEIDKERGVDNINERGAKEQKKSNVMETNERETKENEKRYKEEYKESVTEKNEIRELEETEDRVAEENKERDAEEANEKNIQENEKRNADKYEKTVTGETKNRYADENEDRDALEDKEGQENKEIDVEENMKIFLVENNERNAEEHYETNEEDIKKMDREEYNDNMERDAEKNRKRDGKEHEVRYKEVNMKRDAELNKDGELEENKEKYADAYKELDTEENTARNAEEKERIDTQTVQLTEAEKKEEGFSDENMQCNAEKKCIKEENEESIFKEADKIKEISAERRKEILDYLKRHDVNLEDKFQTALKIGKVTEKDLENYLDNCWRYLVMVEEERRLAAEDEERRLEEMGSEYEGGSEPDYNSDDLEEDENISDTNTEDFLLDPPKPSVHAWWCLVCGKDGSLVECPRCPSSYHPACKEKWPVAVFHRMKQTETQLPEPETCVQGNSSNEGVNDTKEDIENGNIEIEDIGKEDIENNHCPSCTWGPNISYNDIVWNKYGSCPWWPARVLPRREIPDWLLERAHYRGQIPLRYYGTQEHAWATLGRTCLFLPWHVDGQAAGRTAGEPGLGQACLDACDHYVALYLT